MIDKKNFLTKMRYCLIIVAALIMLSQKNLFAEPTVEPAQKGQYHLFNPTPQAYMREMSTDRPDKTESAYTVDAGHYQLEMSLIDYTYDQNNDDSTRNDNFSITPFNVKVGLLNNADIQLVINPYKRERTEDADDNVAKKTGFGDIQTRLKINLWGNDGGQTALAIMPFIKFPTNTDNLGNDDTEGGIIVPLAISLPKNWAMGIMTEFDFNRSTQSDFYTDFVHSITFGHSIIGNLNGYIEFFSKFNQEEGSQWIGTVDTGLTYAVNENIQLDTGVNIGVTNSADDLNPFCGFSIRY